MVSIGFSMFDDDIDVQLKKQGYVFVDEESKKEVDRSICNANNLYYAGFISDKEHDKILFKIGKFVEKNTKKGI